MRRWTEPPERTALSSHSRATVASKTPGGPERRSVADTPELTGVYFIREKRGPVKIGSSSSPFGRFVDLQVATHRELVILGWVTAPRSVERLLHSQLAPWHIRGEWFEWCPETREAIAETFASWPNACMECERIDRYAKPRDVSQLEPFKHTCGVFS